MDETRYYDFINRNKVDLDLEFIKNTPDNLLRIEVTHKDMKVIEVIKNNSTLFEDICYINYGCRLVGKNNNKTKKDYIFLDNIDNTLKPFVEGSDIRRFNIIDSRFVNYSPNEHYLSLFVELFENRKLISKDVVGKDGISVALDNLGYYNDHTTINAVLWCDLKSVNYSGVKRDINAEKINRSREYSYYELLGHINSEISQYYFNKLFNIDLHFYPGTFKNMIVSNNPSIELGIIVNYLVIAKSHNELKVESDYFEDISNCIIYGLYFHDKIKYEGKYLSTYLKDLKPITEESTEEEKLAIIKSEYDRLSHPSHPVRIAIDTLDEVEEVRIIREALNK